MLCLSDIFTIKYGFATINYNTNFQNFLLYDFWLPKANKKIIKVYILNYLGKPKNKQQTEKQILIC